MLAVPPPGPPPEPAPFLAADCALPLGLAIAEHRARVPGPLLGGEDPAILAFLEAHDACHVLFGCSTSAADEARVDTWTLLATTMTFRRYGAYLEHPALKSVYDELLRWRTVRSALGAMVDTPRIWARARAMTRPWDFDRWAEWADVPVRDIRAAHGIRVLGAE